MKRQRVKNHADYRNLLDKDIPLSSDPQTKPLRSENYLEASVQDGETLESIAIRFNCTPTELKRLNKIERSNEIFAFSKIKIPANPYTVLLDTLPAVHTSGTNSPQLKEEVEQIDGTVLPDSSKLSEKLLVESIVQSGPTVNELILNAKVAAKRYRDSNDEEISNVDDHLLNGYLDDEHDIEPHPVMLRPPQNDFFSCDGSDCDFNWICLLIGILALCVIIPLIYVWFVYEHPEKFHHNSTFHHI